MLRSRGGDGAEGAGEASSSSSPPGSSSSARFPSPPLALTRRRAGSARGARGRARARGVARGERCRGPERREGHRASVREGDRARPDTAETRGRGAVPSLRPRGVVDGRARDRDVSTIRRETIRAGPLTWHRSFLVSARAFRRPRRRRGADALASPPSRLPRLDVRARARRCSRAGGDARALAPRASSPRDSFARLAPGARLGAIAPLVPGARRRRPRAPPPRPVLLLPRAPPPPPARSRTLPRVAARAWFGSASATCAWATTRAPRGATDASARCVAAFVFDPEEAARGAADALDARVRGVPPREPPRSRRRPHRPRGRPRDRASRDRPRVRRDVGDGPERSSSGRRGALAQAARRVRRRRRARVGGTFPFASDRNRPPGP